MGSRREGNVFVLVIFLHFLSCLACCVHTATKRERIGISQRFASLVMSVDFRQGPLLKVFSWKRGAAPPSPQKYYCPWQLPKNCRKKGGTLGCVTSVDVGWPYRIRVRKCCSQGTFCVYRRHMVWRPILTCWFRLHCKKSCIWFWTVEKSDGVEFLSFFSVQTVRTRVLTWGNS